MGGELRTPLRLLATAFAVTAALVFLQTFVMRALAYDSPALGVVVVMFRVGFLLADGASLAALFMIGRREPNVHAFSTLAVVGLGLSLALGALGMAIRSSNPGISGYFAAIEPALSFAIAVLVALALGAVVSVMAASDRKRRLATVVPVVAASVVLALRLSGGARAFSDVRVALAWTRWAFAVVQPASLAFLALLVARQAAPVSSSASAVGPNAGAYRVSQEGGGAVSAVRPDLAAPTLAVLEPMTRAQRGITLHRTAYITRVAASAGVVILGIIVQSPAPLFLWPIVGVVTSAMIIVGIHRQRALATFDGGKLAVAAMLAFSLSALMDVGTIGWIAAALFSHGSEKDGMLFVAAATSFTGVGIMFVSHGHARAGDLLFKYLLAGRARWTEGLVVVAGSSLLASLTAFSHLRTMRYYETKLADYLSLGLVLVTAGFAIAFFVMHLLTLSEASEVLRARLALAERAPDQPKEPST